MFIEAPPPIQQEQTIVVTAFSTRKDALNQGVIVLNRDTALINSLSGGIGEAIGSHAGVRTSFFGPNASRPIIRGLGEDRIRLLSNGLQGIDASTISPDHAPAVDGLEAQSIEVLKGAAALRYGSNAVGGVVNIIDGRLPNVITKHGVSGDGFIGVTPRDKANGIAGNLSFATGNIVLRLDGLRKTSEDYAIPGFVQSARLRETTNDTAEGRVFNSGGEIWVRGASAAFIGEKSRIAIAARETNSVYGIPNEEADITLKQTRFDLGAARKFDSFLNEISLAATQGDYSHAEVEHSGAIGTVFRANGYEARLEARLKPEVAQFGAIEAIGGLQISARDFSASGDEAFILPVTIENRGAFFVARIDNDKWGIDFGARSEAADYSGLAGNKSFDAQSGSIGGYVKPITGLRLGLTFAQTERIPTETELFADGPHAATQSFEIGNPNLKSEVAKTIELSLNWRNSGTKLEANLWKAGFDDFIAFAPTIDIIEDLPVYRVTQANAELNGYEIIISQDLWQKGNFAISGELSLDNVRGKYKNGTNIPRMPPKSVTLGLNASSDAISFDAEVQLLSAQKKTAINEMLTDGATIYNFGFSYRPQNFANWHFRADLKNATNEEVREHTSVLKEYLPRPGRSLSLSARYSF